MICEHCKYVIADHEVEWRRPADAARWKRRNFRTVLTHICPRCDFLCQVMPKDCDAVQRLRRHVEIHGHFQEMVPRMEASMKAWLEKCRPEIAFFGESNGHE